jgi:hypothetical protein
LASDPVLWLFSWMVVSSMIRGALQNCTCFIMCCSLVFAWKFVSSIVHKRSWFYQTDRPAAPEKMEQQSEGSRPFSSSLYLLILSHQTCQCSVHISKRHLMSACMISLFLISNYMQWLVDGLTQRRSYVGANLGHGPPRIFSKISILFMHRWPNKNSTGIPRVANMQICRRTPASNGEPNFQQHWELLCSEKTAQRERK